MPFTGNKNYGINEVWFWCAISSRNEARGSGQFAYYSANRRSNMVRQSKSGKKNLSLISSNQIQLLARRASHRTATNKNYVGGPFYTRQDMVRTAPNPVVRPYHVRPCVSSFRNALCPWYHVWPTSGTTGNCFYPAMAAWHLVECKKIVCMDFQEVLGGMPPAPSSPGCTNATKYYYFIK